MAINLARREAFAKSDYFRNYPSILEQFALNNTKLVNPFKKDDQGSRILDPDQKKSVMECMMAQFIVRLVATRAVQCGNPFLVDFSNETVQRYHDFRVKRVGGLEIMADDKYIAALNAFEQEMSNLIFHAIAVEVDDADDFVEADFWRDIMLALCMNTRTYWPKWHLVIQEILLDHMPAFQFALEAPVEVPANETVQ